MTLTYTHIHEKKDTSFKEGKTEWLNVVTNEQIYYLNQFQVLRNNQHEQSNFTTASIHQYANKTNVKSERQATSHTGKQTGSLQWNCPLSSMEKQSHHYRVQVKPIFQKHQRIRLKECNTRISTLGTVLKRAFWEQEHHTRTICLHALDREEPQLHMCFYFTDYFIFDMLLNILFISWMCLHVHIWVQRVWLKSHRIKMIELCYQSLHDIPTTSCPTRRETVLKSMGNM